MADPFPSLQFAIVDDKGQMTMHFWRFMYDLWTQANSSDGTVYQVGDIRWTGRTTVDDATVWVTADGSDLSRTGDATLFAVFGTTYGSGDGSTTFGIPNLTGPLSTMLPLIRRR